MRALVTVGQGVGNIIMATPTIAAVALLGFETDILAQGNYPDAASLLRGWEEIHAVHTDPPRQCYDAVVRTVWHRSGALHCGPEFHPDDCDLRQTHEVVANLTAARALGYAGAAPPAHCEYDEPAGPELPERYVVLAADCGGWTGGFWQRKHWPHWEEFCAGILAASDVDLVALGAQQGAFECPASTWGPLVSLCGRTTLRQAAGVIAGAELVLAIDNGLAHIAAALGVPTLVLFGATSEVKNRPWGPDVTVLTADTDCRPCQMTARWNTCRHWRCMSALGSNTVLDTVMERLDRPSRRGVGFGSSQTGSVN